MARPNVRQRIVEQTVTLLASKGLQGASFSEILDASDAPRGSLYHYFPGGKDELVSEAMKLAGDHALRLIENLHGRPAHEVAAGFIAVWRTLLERSAFRAGCAIMAVTVAADSAALLDQAGDIFKLWRERLALALAAGGVPNHEAGPLAASLIAACEGGIVLARAEQSFEPFDRMAQQQLRQIQGRG